MKGPNMIEHATLARAALHDPRPHWTRPSLPRGPSPLARRLAKLRARVAAIGKPRLRECGC